MDEKHRQYCIKLGNPYMEQEKYSKVDLDRVSDPWIPVENNEPNVMNKFNKKYSN